MRELNPELGRAVTFAMGDDARERGLAPVGVKTEAAMRDPPVTLDIRHLDDDQRSAGIGEHRKVSEMPVVGAAVVGAVLAHGRDDNAIGQFQFAKANGRKEFAGHGRFCG